MLLRSTYEGCLQTAVAIIQDGGIVAFPTDTVYGIGTSAKDDEAVLKLFVVKGRDAGKAIPVLVSNLDQFESVAGDIPSSAKRLAERFWPGPITLVVARGDSIAETISSSDTVGVRMPNHEFALSLLSTAGPMAVTSANITGSRSLSMASEVFEVLNGKIELVIDGGTTLGKIPSTVVDCTGTVPFVLRDGPILQSEIDLFLST
jgi:L-threonylcarbamoyladenylate synthase